MKLLGLMFVVMTLADVSNGYFKCTVDQWEGMIKTTETYIDNPKEGMIQTKSHYFYDATNMRIADYRTKTQNKIKITFQQFTIYTSPMNGTIYIFDVTRGRCFSMQTRMPFMKWCLPVTSKLEGKHFLGAKGFGRLEVADYSFTLPDRTTFNTIAEGDQGYIPVMEGVVQHSTSAITPSRYTIDTVYYDINTEIKDTSVFDIPKQCKKNAQEMKFPEHLTAENFHHEIHRFQ